MNGTENNGQSKNELKELLINEVDMAIESILPIIIENRQNADYTKHELSRATASGPIPCSDIDVVRFFHSLMDGDTTAKLIISNIEWEESGNCVGDDLYPVVLSGVKLPDGRYYIELTGRKIFKEYIFRFT